jgi:hypothetical protein
MELSDEDVKKLVIESVTLIKEVQSDLNLKISFSIDQTEERLLGGNLKADYLDRIQSNSYANKYGRFIPPSTILLEKKLPFCDRPLDMPQFCETMTQYCAVHEVIHADDHTNGDALLLATRQHILESHRDKLQISMKIIEKEGGTTSIKNYEDLSSLWAIQYVDIVTHYRSYVVLRHKKFNKLHHIWSQINNDYFPPNLLTSIELEKGTDYVFSLFTDKAGKYCLIEALEDYKKIKDADTRGYTV